MCQLDNETYQCSTCKGDFPHTDGTWLPIGINHGDAVVMVKGKGPTIINLWSERPQVVTSDNFTCYGCTETLKEND